MDPINQNGIPTGAGSGSAQPNNSSMPPVPEPPKPAEAANEPAAPLETEVNQFTEAKPQSPAEVAPAETGSVAPQADVSPPQNAEPVTESTSPMAEPTPPAVEPAEPAPQPEIPPPVDQIGTLDQAPNNQPQTGVPLQTPPPVKKSKAGLIIIIILAITIVGAGAYYYMTKIRGNTSTSTTTTPADVIQETTPTPTDAGTAAGSTIAAAYEKAMAISATSDKAKTVDTILSPILNKVFSSKIKLTDATSMLAYVTNRPITAADVTAVKTQLEVEGYKSADSTAKQLTMTKTGSTWVISFSVDSQTLAQIDVTY